jgi:nucleoside-diphosphate-sugar epimerase
MLEHTVKTWNIEVKILLIGGCGYIGSKLYEELINNSYDVDTVDIEWFGNYVNKNNQKILYSELRESTLRNYQIIILTAAYSSVAMCEINPLASVVSNVNNFIQLLDKISNGRKFIYMSSSSVYNGRFFASEETPINEATNYYDLTKFFADLWAKISDKEFYGLRLGTVNGFSPNLRSDIMINKMVLSAKDSGKIEVYNPYNARPILGINDLCRAIIAIIEGDDRRGIYNLSSFDDMIGNIAEDVAKILNIPIYDMGENKAYDFSIRTVKFQKTYDFIFNDTIESIVESLNGGLENGTIKNIQGRPISV